MVIYALLPAGFSRADSEICHSK